MAYAAVISLKQTIQRLQNSSRISMVSPDRETMEFAYKKVESLQQALRRLDKYCGRTTTDILDSLDGQMRDTVQSFEDLLESHVLNHLPSLSPDIHSFVQKVENIEKEYTAELDNPSSTAHHDNEHEEAANALAAIIHTDSDDVKMVGLFDEFSQIKTQVVRRIRPYDFCLFFFVGIAGTGRSLLATITYYELFIQEEQSFDCGACVRVGPTNELKDIVVGIITMVVTIDPDELSERDEVELGELLRASLEGRKYMILLDDVWDPEVWEYIIELLPQEDNGSLVVITTGLKEITLSAEHSLFEMPVFTDKKIWNLLQVTMFGEECCPPELEEVGKKIAENCRGLYLLFLKAMLFLSDEGNSLDCWNQLAADEQNPIFTVGDELEEMDQIERDMQHYGEGTFIGDVSNFLNIANQTKNTKMRMFPKRYLSKMEIFSFFGMAGIGKTTLVRQIFEDPSVFNHFEHRLWITLGPKYQPEEILVDILAKIYPEINRDCMKEDAKLAMDLGVNLSYKRCLIVLDDIWDIKPLHFLKTKLPNIKGKVLMTTRLAHVANIEEVDTVHELRLLNKEESWYLLRHKVFPQGLCPYELEKAGKMIAENCDGLPLTIAIVAHLLSEVEKTPENWNEAAKVQSSIFMNAYNQISKVLLPSYKRLPQHLKPCFLFVGVICQNHEIRRSNLIQLWIADGFLEPNMSQTIEDYAAECLLEIVDQSLVMACQKGSNFRIKTCRLHSVFWHLCNIEAAKSKFFHALDHYTDDSIEGLEGQRRLCVRNNILLGIKDVYDSMNTIETTHSMLCTGPPHQYPVPVDLDSRLLRVMNALAIRLYEFPNDVVKKIHLRYLSLTCDGEIPASISNLWNLQYLIAHQNLRIRSSKKKLDLSNEIWDMKELKHLQVMGCSLSDPPICGTLLPKLLTLLGMSAHNCTKEVLKGIPNLGRLGIQIELAPDDGGGKSLYLFDNISLLNKLESLKCVVENPELRFEVVSPPAYGLMFPSCLKKLNLSGLGYPWEYMSIIGKLPNLEVLKLRCYAFQGLEWETNYFSFLELKFLLIEDTDLVCWKLKVPSLPKLKRLSFRHCYKLQELPYDLINLVEMIEVVDCSTFAVTWAKQMEEDSYKVRIHSSYN